MAKRVRGFETVGDMVRSLAVVGVFVVVILAITLRESPPKIKAVDAAPVLAAVAQAAPFEASAPGATPAGWTVTSARVSYPTDKPYTWFVGYSTDTEAFVAVTQVYGDADPYLKEIGANGTPEGEVTINGETWQKVSNPDGTHHALTRTVGQLTTVVVGSAPYDVLQKTAAAITPAKATKAAPTG